MLFKDVATVAYFSQNLGLSTKERDDIERASTTIGKARLQNH